MTSLESRITKLERKVRELSIDIELFVAKDKELLARLRSGQGCWRAMRRSDDFSLPSLGGHPFDEPTPIQDKATGDSSAETDRAVVFAERSNSEQNKAIDQEQDMAHRDTNSV